LPLRAASASPEVARQRSSPSVVLKLMVVGSVVVATEDGRPRRALQALHLAAFRPRAEPVAGDVKRSRYTGGLVDPSLGRKGDRRAVGIQAVAPALCPAAVFSTAIDDSRHLCDARGCLQVENGWGMAPSHNGHREGLVTAQR
jgi:hypothetical protein